MGCLFFNRSSFTELVKHEAARVVSVISEMWVRRRRREALPWSHLARQARRGHLTLPSAVSFARFHLVKLLEKFGHVKQFDFLFHKSGPLEGQPRGYCFVNFNTREVRARRRSFAPVKSPRSDSGPCLCGPGPDEIPITASVCC